MSRRHGSYNERFLPSTKPHVYESDPEGIVSDLRCGRAGPANTLQKLTALGKNNPEGMRLAGELAIDMAAKAPNVRSSRTLLNQAGEMFHNVEEMYSQKGYWPDSTVTRVAVQSAMLPAYRDRILREKLPERPVAETAYGKTLEAGSFMLDVTAISPYANNPLKRSRITGCLAEVAVLALAQRTALQIGPESWFPFPAYFSEEGRHNDRHSRERSNIDMVIVTDQGDPMSGSPLSIDYRLQIKSRPYKVSESQPPYKRGISMICVNPQLAANSHEVNPIRKIITECTVERNLSVAGQSEQASRIASHLDHRIELFLNLLDTTPQEQTSSADTAQLTHISA